MAARKPAAPKPAAPVDYRAALQPSAGLTAITRGSEPNPLVGVVDTDAALMLPVPNSDEARKVTNWLRRDANDRNLGVRIQYKANGEWVTVTRETVDGKEKTVYPDGISEVHFQGKARSKRQYTAENIRAWYLNQYGEELSGPIPADVRDDFKHANGYAKAMKATD